jgi:Rieske Fe-S protein
MQQRRRFLQVLGSAAFVAACGGGDDGGGSHVDGGGGRAGGGGQGQGGEGGDAPSLVPAGNVATIAEGTLVGVPQLKMLLGRDAGGVYAMTSICTHKKCDMLSHGGIVPTGVNCSCHLSRFDLLGQVLMGPASLPLAHFYCELGMDGTVLVDPTAPVDPGFRAPVPA